MEITLPLYYDPWMLNGAETFYRLVENVEGCNPRIYSDRIEVDIQNKEIFLRNLTDKIKDMQDKVIFYTKLDDTGQKKYVKKDFVLIQYGKAEKRNVLKEKIFLETEERLSDIFSHLEPGKRTCILCRRTFGRKVDHLKQAVHPFATKIKSLSGVRTMKENFDNICPLCYLVGTLEWLDEGIVYRSFLGPAGKTYSVVLLPFEMDLKKTNEAKKRYKVSLSGEQSVSNVRRIVRTSQGDKLMPPEGEHTTVLKFFEVFIEEIMAEYKEKELGFDEMVEKTEKVFCKQWSMLTIPSGTVKNVKYRQLILEDEIVSLLIQLQNEGVKAYEDIIERIGVIEKDGRTSFDDTNDLREDAAKFILENTFRKFSRIFLPKKKNIVFFGKVDNLDLLLRVWRLRKMELEQKLETLRGSGETLAKLIEKHVSILYAMDKAKTKAEFLRAFEQAARRLVGLDEKTRGDVYPLPLGDVADLIIESDETQWREIRDALIIYASISYSRNEYNKLKKSGKVMT